MADDAINLVDPPGAPKTVYNQATISSSQLSGPLTSNKAYVNLTKKYTNMTITKTAYPTAAVSGTPVKFTITIKNTGTINAANVHFTDNVPDEFTITATNPGPPTLIVFRNNVSGNLGTINAGATVTVTINCIVK